MQHMYAPLDTVDSRRASSSSAAAPRAPERNVAILGLAVLALGLLVLGATVSYMVVAADRMAPTMQRLERVLRVADEKLDGTRGDALAALVGTSTAADVRTVMERASLASFTLFPTNVPLFLRSLITFNFPALTAQVQTMVNAVINIMNTYANNMPQAASSIGPITETLNVVSQVAGRISTMTPPTTVTATSNGIFDLVFGSNPLDWMTTLTAPPSYKALGGSCVSLINQISTLQWNGTYPCSAPGTNGTCTWTLSNVLPSIPQTYILPACQGLAAIPI